MLYEQTQLDLFRFRIICITRNPDGNCLNVTAKLSGLVSFRRPDQQFHPILFPDERKLSLVKLIESGLH